MSFLVSLVLLTSSWSAEVPSGSSCKPMPLDVLQIEDSGPWWFIPSPQKPFEISSAELQRLRNLLRGVRVRIYYGSWCSDSRKHLPEFLSLLKQAQIEIPLEWIPLDRAKSAPGFKLEEQVERVPTFIFLKGQREIGRVVEHPQPGWVQTLLSVQAK